MSLHPDRIQSDAQIIDGVDRGHQHPQSLHSHSLCWVDISFKLACFNLYAV